MSGKMSFIFLFLTAALTALAHSAQFDFTHSLVLDSQGKFMLYWKPDLENKRITFEVEVQTQGWVGLGFAPKGSMAGADIVVGWVDNHGKAQISDRYATANGFPMQDDTQNYKLLEANKNNTHTRLRFSRVLDTCDENDWKINDDTVRLLWAYDDTIPTNSDNFMKHKAGNRGARSTQLLIEQKKGQFDSVKREQNVKTVELNLENVQLPNHHHTLYWCKIFKFPHTQKQHLIGHEMVIQPGNEKYVHHMILYRCRGDLEKFANSTGQRCFSEDDDNFNPMKQCGEFILAWAVGGEPYAYPPNVGLPFFGNDKDAYYMMEMHYDNSDYIGDVQDSSGLRMYLTDNLRPIEAGLLTMGIPPNPVNQIIPPNQKRFTSFSYCSSQCTQDMPTEGHTIFSGLLHTHLIGTAFRVRHIRDGTELEPIFQDEHYDFNYQNIMIKHKPTKIFPGDEFIVECEYDSTARKEATVGGESTVEEMCLVFLEFYPRGPTDGYGCFGSPDSKESFQFLGASDSIKTNNFDGYAIDKSGNRREVQEFLRSEVDWQQDNKYGLSAQFQRLVKNAKQKQMCYMGGRFKSMDIYGAPMIFETFKPQNQCSQTQTNTSAYNQISEIVQNVIDIIT